MSKFKKLSDLVSSEHNCSIEVIETSFGLQADLLVPKGYNINGRHKYILIIHSKKNKKKFYKDAMKLVKSIPVSVNCNVTECYDCTMHKSLHMFGHC